MLFGVAEQPSAISRQPSDPYAVRGKKLKVQVPANAKAPPPIFERRCKGRYKKTSPRKSGLVRYRRYSFGTFGTNSVQNRY